MHHILIQDAHTNGQILNEVLLEIPTPTITVGELIRLRVEQEAMSFQSHPGKSAISIRQKGDGSRFAALQAFRENGFTIFVNNQSIRQLDQEIALQPDTNIRFVQLPA
jgi:hypothetical protein